MGRFGIGARVRDLEGDEGVITAKRKGERYVLYDDVDYGSIWNAKSRLTPIDVPTPASREAQIEKIEPGVEAPEVTPASPWEPKVGDRVRVKDDRGGGKIGDDCTVTRVEPYGNGEAYCRLDGLSDGAEGLYSYRLEPLPVEPSPITLEVGRLYKTRDGRKVGPAKLSNYPSDICKWSVGDTWLRQDNGMAGSGDVPAYDIVAEWVEPVAEPEVAEPAPAPVVVPTATVSVGDRVWDVTDSGEKWMAGTVRTVREDGQFQLNYDDGDTGSLWWTLEEWGHHEPVEVIAPSEAAPAPAPAQEASPAPTGSFIVARLTAKGEPRPNVRPRVHATIELAEQEAQRLADRLGDEFAVYQRVSTKTVDAGPVPEDFDLEQARLTAAHKGAVQSAFVWARTKQGHGFWRDQRNTGLTHIGRAIIRKWIAEAEAATNKEAA